MGHSRPHLGVKARIAVVAIALTLLGGGVALASYGGGGALGHASTNRDAVYIAPQRVVLTQFSPRVRGNEGIAPAGPTTVSVTLSRGDTTVATASGPVSDADGTWSVQLLPVTTTPASRTQAPSLDDDVIQVHYTGPGAPPDQIVGGHNGRRTLFGLLRQTRINAARNKGEFPNEGGCSDVNFLVNGTVVPTAPVGFECQANFSPTITDSDHVQVEDTQFVSEVRGTGPGRVEVIGDAPLPRPGFENGPPICDADYVDGTISCSGLNGFPFTANRARGNETVALTYDGGNFQASAAMPGGFQTGDTVTLTEQGISRVMSTLKLDTLRTDAPSFSYEYGIGGPGSTSADETFGGSCSPNKWLTQFPFFGFVTDLCNPDGTQPASSGGFDTATYDDTSGGSASVDIPDFEIEVPANGESIEAPFFAYADTFGPTPKTITLTIHQRNADGTNGSQVGGTLTVDPVKGVEVSGLGAGRYNATWLLTDTHGDTRTLDTQFIVQPGGGGPPGAQGQNGAQGPQGLQGPQGPAGSLITGVSCHGKLHKHHRVKITCKLQTAATGSVRIVVSLTRGKMLYALGSHTVHGRHLRMTLREARPAPRGSYRVTLVFAQRDHLYRMHTRMRL
jgi:hypothetical protein